MRAFDLLLVIGTFRSATPMLSVVKDLASRFKIGVLFADLDEKMADKTAPAQALFRDLCLSFGATLCPPEETVQTQLMLVQQFPYTESFRGNLRARVKADRVWGLMTLAWAGIEPQDAFIKHFAVERLVVPDKQFASFLIERRGAQARYAGVEMIEVGLPFRDHPIFPDFHVDWIVAAPTLFSFHTEEGKQAFLRDALRLLAQVPASDIVAYKSHNGNRRDYFAPKLYDTLARLLRFVPRAESILNRLTAFLPRALGMPLRRVVTGLLHQRLLRRAKPLADLTPYDSISIEAFMPGVRRGIVGGLSNTIWGALFFGLPYYNCVNPEDRGQGDSELLKKDSASLLDTNLEFFGVPYCGGDLSRGATNAAIAYAPNRHRDLVKTIEQDLVERDVCLRV